MSQAVKFDMSQAWSQATAMLRANRDLVVVIAGVFFFLPMLALSLTLPDVFANLPSDPEARQTALVASLQALVSDYWWAFLLVEIVQGIGALTLLALLRDSSRPTLAEALKLGALAILPYFAARIVILLAVLLSGTIIGSIGTATGIGAVAIVFEGLAVVTMAFLFTRLSLTVPAIGIERVYNPLAALLRSWRLTKGSAGRLFAFYILIGVCTLVIYLVAAMILGLLFAALGKEAQTILSALLSGVLVSAVFALAIAILAAAHRQFAGGATAA